MKLRIYELSLKKETIETIKRKFYNMGSNKNNDKRKQRNKKRTLTE